MSRPRILFLATHPREAASTRYRVLAYCPVLETAGFHVDFQAFFPSQALAAISAPGRWGRKLGWVLRGTWERWRALRLAEYDLVVIHRELFPWGMAAGTALLLRALRRRGCRVVYDFDDAMYLPQRQHRTLIGRLEDPSHARALISMSRHVIAGNGHLAAFAREITQAVTCIPTPVDTTQFTPGANGQLWRICTVGWIGSPSTAKYLRSLTPVFERLAKTHAFRLKIVGANQRWPMKGVAVDDRPWVLEREAEEFRTCEIGVYPLWDDEWSKGKCGFKALQFMACGVPVVGSAVGMNLEIIRPGDNGLLAASPEEWEAKLAQLLTDEALRKRLGSAGRQTIEEQYALSRLTPSFIETIRTALS